MGAVLAVALPVFGLILTGALAGRARFLGEDATRVLNLFVVYLALPAVLVQAMAHIRPADLANPGLLLAFGSGILLPFLLALIVARRRGTPLADATLQALSGTYANVGYMGIPLCLTAFGEASVVPGVITMVITACPQFALAVTLIELDRQQQPHLGRMIGRVGGALARNPLLIAPVVGIGIAASGHALPIALDRFLGLLAGAATPCALVATGLMIAESGERFRPGRVAWLTGLKLLVQPAITWAIAFHVVRLPPGWAETAVVMSALPTGTGAFILAKLYGREAATTSGTVLVSTILSFFTLSALLAWTGARG
ncbi:MAG: AEC family transporter [Rhodospirillales bacterium]|nr:AEC family transporter [Rhodospirillales bacterium]